jgi:hypothetical protein
MRVESAAAYVLALENELSALGLAVDDLAAQISEMGVTLDALYAAAELTGTLAAQQVAIEAEQAQLAADAQLRRKRAALFACAQNLANARQTLALAKKVVYVEQLESIHGEMASIASALDENIGQPALWLRLIKLAQQAQSIYATNLRSIESFSDFEPDMLQSLTNVQFKFRKVVKEASNNDSLAPPMPSVSVELGLEIFARRIAALRTRIDNA